MLTTRFAFPNTFDTVAREFDRLFSDATSNASTAGLAPASPVALWEDNQHVYLEVDVPGVTQENLELTLRDGRLWIRGERKPAQHEGKCWYNERRYGTFERVVSMSDMVDPSNIEAELENGVLFITLNKKPEHQPHRIAINANSANGRKRLSKTES